MSLIRKIISGGQAGVDRGAIEAAQELGFPYGGLIPKGRIAEDGQVSSKFSCMTEDAREYCPHWAEQNIINSDATLILSRTSELSDDAKRIEESCKTYGKPYWIDNPEQPNETDRGLEFLYWVEAEFLDRGIVLNVAGSMESREPGIQKATCEFVKQILEDTGVEESPQKLKIIGESPFVKEVDGDGIKWLFKAIDPVAYRVIYASISPNALMNSLGVKHGTDELLTCSCGIAACDGIRYERFESTEDYVRWSFNYRGTARTLYFDRTLYEIGAIVMLNEVYRSRVGWWFNFYEYQSYDAFKTAVDQFLCTKPHYKAIWDGLLMLKRREKEG